MPRGDEPVGVVDAVFLLMASAIDRNALDSPPTKTPGVVLADKAFSKDRLLNAGLLRACPICLCMMGVG